MTGAEAFPTVGPARAWAYEHYGFADGAPVVPPPVVSTGAPATQPAAPRGVARRSRMVAAGAVLALLLVGGVGGAALAAAEGVPVVGVDAWFDGTGDGGNGGGPGDGGPGGGR